MIRKVMLATAVMALASTPAWALPAKAPTNEGTSRAPKSTPAGPPAGTPNDGSNPGSKDRSEAGGEHAGGGDAGAGRSTDRPDAGGSGGGHGEEGKANAGKAKADAEDGKGHHERGKADAGKGKAHRCRERERAYVVAGIVESAKLEAEGEGARHPTYTGEVTVEVKRANRHAREAKGSTVEYALSHVHLRGNVPFTKIAEGDRARLIGRVTFMHRRCEAEEFTPEIRIHRIVVHAPRRTRTTTTTTTTSSSTG